MQLSYSKSKSVGPFSCNYKDYEPHTYGICNVKTVRINDIDLRKADMALVEFFLTEAPFLELMTLVAAEDSNLERRIIDLKYFRRFPSLAKSVTQLKFPTISDAKILPRGKREDVQPCTTNKIYKCVRVSIYQRFNFRNFALLYALVNCDFRPKISFFAGFLLAVQKIAFQNFFDV